VFIVVLRKGRSINGRFGNHDMYVWANAVEIERTKEHTKVYCIQEPENEMDDPRGPTYTVYGKQNGGWEHFYVMDGRTGKTVRTK
jgi:hypothetical protein